MNLVNTRNRVDSRRLIPVNQVPCAGSYRHTRPHLVSSTNVTYGAPAFIN